MVQIISFANQTDGVGKTKMQIDLGANIENHGYKVKIVDVNLTGNADSVLWFDK